MNNVNQDAAFLWASSDVSGVVSAATGSLLHDLTKSERIRPMLTRTSGPEELIPHLTNQLFSMALWVVRHEVDFPPVCRAILTARKLRKDTVCVAFIDSTDLAGEPILIEAGAHMVLRSIAALQLALPKILSVAPHSPHAFHPLTRGLLQRLPWTDC